MVDGDIGATPMRRQYLDLKAQYPGTILFFRLGDFYETFDDDAQTCSQVLQITLTAREIGKGRRVPMAGVPAHAVQSYLARMVQSGYTVAICDQIDDGVPSTSGRTMMSRKVTRVVTPGTVVEPAMLEPGKNTYVVALVASTQRANAQVAQAPESRAWGLAYADLSTGEFRCMQTVLDGDAVVRRELARLRPAECVVPKPANEGGASVDQAPEWWRSVIDETSGTAVTPWDDRPFTVDVARETLLRRFGVASLSGYGCEALPLAIRAAGALVSYCERTLGRAHEGSGTDVFAGLATYSPEAFVQIDPFTRRNLGLDTGKSSSSRVEATASGGTGTLFHVVDTTRTAIGGRLLRRWIGQPLVQVRAINARLDGVGRFHRDGALRESVRAELAQIVDLERLLGRVSQAVATPRELDHLCRSLRAVDRIRATLRAADEDRAGSPLEHLYDQIDPCEEIGDLIERAVVIDAVSGSDGVPNSSGKVSTEPGTVRIIRSGYAIALDDLVETSQAARSWIANLEGVERDRSGISTLRVGYNRVFGYFIHVPNRYVERAPANYIRRQTLADGERYVTTELKEYERQVMHASEAIDDLQRRVYGEVLATVATATERLRKTAGAIAELDCLAALAETAVRRQYVRPVVDETVGLEIDAGRHPVVEFARSAGTQALPEAFVPNDCHLDGDGDWAVILTGPNMAGKSTYLRSVALIVLLAHVGSFVPADRARIGVVDRIFTRVGANDDLAAGRSTFMVEMVEAAQILRHATRRSLVILDEIGRGTSTLDGLAIAQAVIEHLHHGSSVETDVGLGLRVGIDGRRDVANELPAGIPPSNASLDIPGNVSNTPDPAPTPLAPNPQHLVGGTIALLAPVAPKETGEETAFAMGSAHENSVTSRRGDGQGIRPRTLFATHYHELADLKDSLDGVRNARMAILEEGDRVVFLHRVVEGASGRSYGVHVARLAGMPGSVTDRASALLEAAEAAHGPGLPRGRGVAVDHSTQVDMPRMHVVGPVQLTFFAPRVDTVRAHLRSINIESLTPLDALNVLAHLRILADEPIE